MSAAKRRRAQQGAAQVQALASSQVHPDSALPPRAYPPADHRCTECRQHVLRHEWDCSYHVDNRKPRGHP